MYLLPFAVDFFPRPIMRVVDAVGFVVDVVVVIELLELLMIALPIALTLEITAVGSWFRLLSGLVVVVATTPFAAVNDES